MDVFFGFKLSIIHVLLQAICLPMSHIGASYYKRKLKLHNLTVYDHAVYGGSCYCWTEDQMRTGPNEIGTAVHHWLTRKAGEGAEEVALYSDSCGGQNRNKYLVAMLLHLLFNSSLKKITHKVSLALIFVISYLNEFNLML